MGTIIRQPNGRWKARYRDANGRSRSQTFDRKQDAQDFQDDSSTDMRRGEWIDPRSRRITFDRIADLWWATTVRLRPTTRRGYHGLLERHVRPFFSGRRVVDLGYLDVEDFIAKKLDSGLSPKYTRDCTSVLSLIMKTAVKAGVRRDNPAAGHTIEVRQRKVRQGDGVIDMEQAHRLIAQVRDPYKPAVWLLVFTGMRPAELCGVRVKSADLVRGIVHVTETVLPVPKFGDEPYRSAVTGPPKSAAGDRSIPIPKWLCDDLAAMLAARAKRRGSQIDASEYLFQTRYGNPLHRDKFRENVVRPALKAAGLPDIRNYDLRHTHASHLIDMGANPLAVAHRLGHSDPAMTLRVYGHLLDGVQEELTEQLDKRRAAAGKSVSEPAVIDLFEARSGHEKDTRDTKKTPKSG